MAADLSRPLLPRLVLAALLGPLALPGLHLAQGSDLPGAAGDAGATTPTRTVVFSEVMWMGSEASTADEWLELCNTTASPVDLSGWCITRLYKGAHQVMVELPDIQVAPGRALLVANYAPSEARCALAVQPDVVTTALTLANTRLQLCLLTGPPGSGGVLVDVADDGRGAPLAGTAQPPAAMVRVDLAADGTTAAAWETASSAVGWKPGVDARGTPGAGPEPEAGAAATTAAPAMAWGGVKRAGLPR